MTVCIAALADNGKKVVVASDQMTSSPVGTMVYEWQNTDVHKIFNFPKGVVLMAGADSNSRAVIDSAINIINEKPEMRSEEMLETFRAEYQKFRLNKFVTEML